MNYRLEISKEADKKFNKLSKKNKRQLEIIDKKVQEILSNPYHFKPLRSNMKNIRRVHISKSFVLTYEILESKKVVRLLNYKHHDKIYK
jgi:YafQ family addiction module toxin component